MALKAGDPAAGGGNDPQNPNPGAFDPAAFETKIMAAMNNAMNGIAKSLKTDLTKLIQPNPPQDPDPNPDPANPPNPKPNAQDPQTNAELQSQRRELAALSKRLKDAEEREKKATDSQLETERVTSIRSVLNDIPFADQASRDLFFSGVTTKIKRDENGSLIAESEAGTLPYKDFIQSEAERYPRLLAPTGASGAGAKPGRSAGGKRWSAADLEPAAYAKLKPEEQAELSQAILAGQVT
jgi:hypothetical protein